MSRVKAHSLFTQFDIALFKSGKHFRLYEKFGSHIITVEGVKGTYFAVWAPTAKMVSVIGDFNNWENEAHQLNVRWDSSGIWEGFIPDIKAGSCYKYKIESYSNIITEKADPYALRGEHPPQTASEVYALDYKWKDTSWMKNRAKKNSLEAPFSVYEVHLGSWKKNEEEGRSLSYTELADELVVYVKEMNFTHVEFMPIMAYPYDPSWGYQITGYFAPTARFGYPEELMLLIDKMHQAGIGVILDWVPSHFPEDANGLGLFDGSHLYEHPDRRKGYHPDWKSLIFNYSRNEVRAFLISNALFWLEKYHIDGLRVDAVASMLYLDYSREDHEWEPNIYGGNEYLEAASFLKEFNEAVYAYFPDVQTIAEESTSFPMVTKPTFMGGLGFGMKWMMGWMHDTLEYFKKEPIYRKHHQNDITFGMTYAFTENFMLPLSHDEVVYGKKSLLDKMPGDEWQRFANLRLLFSYMFTHPGSKLIFQGGEFGQSSEWNFQKSLDWHLLDYDYHKGVSETIKELNTLYKSQPALHEKQFSSDGFQWIEWNDSENSVLSFMRTGFKAKETLVVIHNFTPVPRVGYRVGMPENVFKAGSPAYQIYNSNAQIYGGSDDYIIESVDVESYSWNSRQHSIVIDIPPLATVIFSTKAQ